MPETTISRLADQAVSTIQVRMSIDAGREEKVIFFIGKNLDLIQKPR